MISSASRRSAAIGAAAMLIAASAALASAPASALSGAVPTQSVEQADAVQWTVTPANAEGPDDRISLRHVIEPGATVQDAIAVENQGSTAARFTVAAGDGVIGSSGNFDVVTDAPIDSGQWIRVDGLNDGGVDLEPGETRVLPVEISVPADATPGDHPAGIVAGLTTGDELSVTNRLGVRLHLRVAGDIAPQLSVTAVSASFTPSWIPFAPGSLRVDYRLSNDGNVRLGGSTLINGSGPFGLGPEDSVVPAGELLPGDVVEATADLSVSPLMLFGGAVEVTPLIVGDDDVALPDATRLAYQVVAVSWTGIALVALLVLAILVPVLVRRRRRKAAARPVAENPVAESERREERQLSGG